MAYTKEERAEYQRQWRLKNPAKLEEYAEKRVRTTERRWGVHTTCKLMTKYGITEEIRAQMLVDQNGECAICHVALTTPYVDHCHSTGRVRGLLCNNCNIGLGHFKDDTETLANAIAYLAG